MVRKGQVVNGPINEEVVYNYLVDMCHSGAPATRAQSFLEALRFAGGVIGQKVPADIFSGRVRGAAARAYSRLRARKPAELLPVGHVRLKDLSPQAPR